MQRARIRTMTALAGLAAASLALAGCASGGADDTDTGASAETITVTHKQGETEVPLSPEKVVVFDLATLDTLDTLGVEPVAVPEAVLPTYLSAYESTPKAGSLFEPDYEAVAEIDPDLIIVAARSSEALPELDKIAPTIDLTVDWTDYRAEFTTAVETLGQIFEKDDEAAAALQSIDEKMTETAGLAADAGTALIVSTSGNELQANGLESRYGWIHSELGFEMAVEEVEAATHGDPISNEFVLETDPDWLFVIDRDAAVGESDSASARELIDNELIRQTSAFQNDQVVYLSPSEWYIVMYGLNAVDVMVDEVHSALS